MEGKTRSLAIRLSVLSRKRYSGTMVPCISFEELRVPFQDTRLMDLRARGFLTLSSGSDGQGVQLKRIYLDMPASEFYELLK